MSGRNRPPAIARPLELALREFSNALGKSAMYPAGHRFVASSATALADRLGNAMVDRDSLTIGVTPRGLILDGTAVEPLSIVLRDFANRLHRKNVGTIQVLAGLDAAETATMLGALAASDAEEKVGREGIRLPHIRVEPLVYDVLAFADPLADQDIDDVFWAQLVEAAYGRRLAETETQPNAAQIAEGLSERAAQGADGARRVYEALAAFSSALVARGERATGNARRRFVDVLSALSRPTTTRVVAAAPSAASRRRFLRETLALVPPPVLMQLLESVAEADGEPISPQLRWLLGKLAGGGDDLPVDGSGAFASQVLGLVEQWDGVASQDDEVIDPRLGMEPARAVAIGLELAMASPPVVDAARALAARGQLGEVLRLLDDAGNDPVTVRVIADAVLDPGLLAELLGEATLDFPLIERVAMQSGVAAVTPLLDALGTASERATRRRLLDLLVRIGPPAEPTLLGRLEGASWHLTRNILAVLTQFPSIGELDPVFKELVHPEIRVRMEALKVLVRQPAGRDRAVAEALESGEESLTRMALTALGPVCPPTHVGAVLAVLSHPNTEIQLQAVNLLAPLRTPLVVPRLLTLVRTRSGLFRRLRLLPKSPAMLAALAALARQWSNHRPVLSVLQLAAKSSDPDIVAAVQGGGR